MSSYTGDEHYRIYERGKRDGAAEERNAIRALVRLLRDQERGDYRFVSVRNFADHVLSAIDKRGKR